MPNRAARPCKHGGCPSKATDGRFCDRHAAIPEVVRPYDRWRGSSHLRGYDADWGKVRAFVLERDHHLCQHCLRKEILTPAREVDHIVPIAQGGARLDPDNCQSLCKPCHSRKTATEDSSFARKRT